MVEEVGEFHMVDSSTLVTTTWDATKVLLVVFNGAVGILVSIIGGFLVNAMNRMTDTLDKVDKRMFAMELKVAEMDGYKAGAAAAKEGI